MRLKAFLDNTASAAMIIAACAILYVSFGRTSPKPRAFSIPTKPIAISGSAFLGAPTASSVAIIYSDFNCPFCKKFALEILPSLRAKYVDTGRLGLVFKHFPIEALHPRAFRAAEIASCSGRFGRFWEMHDALFDAPSNYDADSLKGLAERSGVDVATLSTCLAAPPSAKIREEISEARALGVASTPLILIGRKVGDGSVSARRFVAGARPVGEFEAALEAVIAGRF